MAKSEAFDVSRLPELLGADPDRIELAKLRQAAVWRGETPERRPICFSAPLTGAKADRRGRVVDIHALRHTFGTHLSAAGVHPRTAMAAMRHSRIELTTCAPKLQRRGTCPPKPWRRRMNYYTDPVLLDVAGAVGALPSFSGHGDRARASSCILTAGAQRFR